MSTSDEQALRKVRIKNAVEAYKELCGIYTDPVTEEVDPILPTWPVFRDKFVQDWKANRIVVDEKEADAIFDKIVDEAEEELATGMKVMDSVEIVPESTPVVDVVPVEPTRSKADIGREIYKNLLSRPRKEVIEALINVAGMTKAGASTYYQRYRSEFGE